MCVRDHDFVLYMNEVMSKPKRPDHLRLAQFSCLAPLQQAYMPQDDEAEWLEDAIHVEPEEDPDERPPPPPGHGAQVPGFHPGFGNGGHDSDSDDDDGGGPGMGGRSGRRPVSGRRTATAAGMGHGSGYHGSGYAVIPGDDEGDDNDDDDDDHGVGPVSEADEEDNGDDDDTVMGDATAAVNPPPSDPGSDNSSNLFVHDNLPLTRPENEGMMSFAQVMASPPTVTGETETSAPGTRGPAYAESSLFVHSHSGSVEPQGGYTPSTQPELQSQRRQPWDESDSEGGGAGGRGGDSGYALVAGEDEDDRKSDIDMLDAAETAAAPDAETGAESSDVDTGDDTDVETDEDMDN